MVYAELGDGFRVNFDDSGLYGPDREKRTKFTPKERDILLCFAQRPGKQITGAMLLAAVTPPGKEPKGLDSIYKHIESIKNKLKENGCPAVIQRFDENRNSGYRYTGSPVVNTNETPGPDIRLQEIYGSIVEALKKKMPSEQYRWFCSSGEFYGDPSVLRMLCFLLPARFFRNEKAGANAGQLARLFDMRRANPVHPEIVEMIYGALLSGNAVPEQDRETLCRRWGEIKTNLRGNIGQTVEASEFISVKYRSESAPLHPDEVKVIFSDPKNRETARAIASIREEEYTDELWKQTQKLVGRHETRLTHLDRETDLEKATQKTGLAQKEVLLDYLAALILLCLEELVLPDESRNAFGPVKERYQAALTACIREKLPEKDILPDPPAGITEDAKETLRQLYKKLYELLPRLSAKEQMDVLRSLMENTENTKNILDEMLDRAEEPVRTHSRKLMQP